MLPSFLSGTPGTRYQYFRSACLGRKYNLVSCSYQMSNWHCISGEWYYYTRHVSSTPKARRLAAPNCTSSKTRPILYYYAMLRGCCFPCPPDRRDDGDDQHQAPPPLDGLRIATIVVDVHTGLAGQHFHVSPFVFFCFANILRFTYVRTYVPRGSRRPMIAMLDAYCTHRLQGASLRGRHTPPATLAQEGKIV